MLGSSKRAVILVFDSLGVGALPDASAYGDQGSNTLGNMSEALGGLELDNLCALGLGSIEGVRGVKKVLAPTGAFGRMKEASIGKDTTTGHWELAGIVIERPFATFSNGFPPEMMERFTRVTGRGWLFAGVASGTEIINELGAEHLASGRLIVYTSADSVFQIAAHEDVVPLEELYEVCRRTRGFLDLYKDDEYKDGEHKVLRVIARPFIGSAAGGFKRTSGRKDFSIEPPGETVLDRLKVEGVEVIGVGKVPDIFAHRGFTQEQPASGNMGVIDGVISALKRSPKDNSHGAKDTLVFANLVDFDMLYGHRNDARGYARALIEADKRLPEVMGQLCEGDMLLITADHGCDPTTPSTDHSREYVPLLVYGKEVKGGVNLGTRDSFSDLGQTVAEYFGSAPLANGESFLGEIIGEK